jgi:hypothetical protein
MTRKEYLERVKQDELEAQAMEDAKPRNVRNRLLAETDYILLTDSQASDECKAEFLEYRQALRDLDMDNPIWPIKPEYVKKIS